MLIFLSLLIALIGLLMFLLSGKADTKEVGKIMFFCGLLAFLMRVPDRLVGIM